MATVPASSVLGESAHDQISPVGLILRKPELEQRDSRVPKVSQTFSHPVRVLGACASGEAPKVVLIGCEGPGWEAVSTCSAGGQSNLLQVLPKMVCVWFGFWDDSNHRQKTVLYYSRLYYTVIQ